MTLRGQHGIDQTVSRASWAGMLADLREREPEWWNRGYTDRTDTGTRSPVKKETQVQVSPAYDNKEPDTKRMFAKSIRKVRGRGQSLVELLVGLLALIPIVLAIFDLAVIVIAVQMNDSTCREACRVAASGPPDSQDIQQRAGAIIARANNRASGMMSNFQLISATSTASSNFISSLQTANGQTFGGPVNGTVTIITEVDVRPFIVQWCYNGTTPLRFRSSQTFPITYVIPNTVGSASANGGLTGGGGSSSGSGSSAGP